MFDDIIKNKQIFDDSVFSGQDGYCVYCPDLWPLTWEDCMNYEPDEIDKCKYYVEHDICCFYIGEINGKI